MRETEQGQALTPKQEEGVDRRSFLTYTIAGSTLSLGASMVSEAQAQLSVPNLLGSLPLNAVASGTLPLTPPDTTDFFDVGDSINLPSQLTMPLVRIDIVKVENPDPTKQTRVRLWLPRLEQGNGTSTSIAIMLAEELGLNLDQVEAPLEIARNELSANQITGGSANTRAFDLPMPLLAAKARTRLLTAAALQFNTRPELIRMETGGVLLLPTGARVSMGQLSAAAAALPAGLPELVKPPVATPGVPGVSGLRKTSFRLIGKKHRRLDARDIVTGKKRYSMDLTSTAEWNASQPDDRKAPLRADGKGALDIAKPTMMLMPPRINMAALEVLNEGDVKRMPGVIAVVKIPKGGATVPYPPGVAVMAETFGQAWDAARALKVKWEGTQNGSGTYISGGSLKAGVDNNSSINTAIRNGILPMPKLPAGVRYVEGEFTYPAAVAATLEVECAIVDVGVVKKGFTEIWAGLQCPQATQNAVALDLALNPLSIRTNVIASGGSFGRRLFWDPVQCAAYVSKVTGHVCKLMYHRSDDMRHTRGRPQQNQRLQAAVVANRVVQFTQFSASPRLDTRHGYGDVLTAVAVSAPAQITSAAGIVPGQTPGTVAVEQFFYKTMVASPYNWGLQNKQLLPLNNVIMNTVSYRSVHIMPARSCEEMLVDELAEATGMSPLGFRMRYLRLERARKVLQKAYEMSGWEKYNHRAMKDQGRALGLAVHQEAKSFTACVVEVQVPKGFKPLLENETVIGPIVNGQTQGIKVINAWIAVDVGKPVNYSGLRAQFEGGLAESISLVLDAGLNFKDGLPVEFSYNNYRLARMSNFPPVKMYIFPNIGDETGGAGEVGMSAAAGAIGNAYRRATDNKPRVFPLNGLTKIDTTSDQFPKAGTLPPKPATFR